jgi:glycosyltransferase involved in cell wall biosynthesis
MASVSVIATVYNEGAAIHRLMRSLDAQTRPPDEIVVVDGGSTDDTVTIMESYTATLPLKIIVADGANISEGRNRAFDAATGDIIAVTDAGVELPPDWLAELVAPFASDTPPDVVAGFFRADTHTLFELAMGATVLPLADEIDASTFLPSSRSVALTRSAFAAVGGYPEWLDYCEDLIFDLRLKQVGVFTFAPQACVAFRPRGTLRAFFKQYYLYARGDGKADLWRKRHAVRYITYLVAAPMLLMLTFGVHPLFGLLLLFGGIIYTRTPYRRLRTLAQDFPRPIAPHEWLTLIMLVPLIRVVGDVAKMFGYPVGWRWRLANRPADWRQIP